VADSTKDTTNADKSTSSTSTPPDSGAAQSTSDAAGATNAGTDSGSSSNASSDAAKAASGEGTTSGGADGDTVTAKSLAGEGGKVLDNEPVAGSTGEDPDQDGRAEGSSEGTGLGGDTVPDDQDLSATTKKVLHAQASAAGIDPTGTKQEIADRLTKEGIEVAVPKGPNGCLTDESCLRPPHPAAPYAHAYGQASEVGLG
jgi:hypothetical protein